MGYNYKEKVLSLVGTGIKTLSHLTKESEAHIKQADLVIFLVNEPVMVEWIVKNSKKYNNLHDLYFASKDRDASYKEISKFILEQLKYYNFICIVFYGHPTVFATPGLNAIKQAELLGVRTFVLPAMSSQDCMFADLKINPGDCGCYSVEAMDLIFKSRRFDTGSHLLIWQPAIIGNYGHFKDVHNDAVCILKDYLLQYYPSDHFVYLYEASIYPGMDCNVVKFKLINLEKQELTTIMTLYIPPLIKKTSSNKFADKLKFICGN